MQLPDDCIRLAEPVPYPKVVAREDLGVRSAKFAAGMRQANETIVAVRTCDIKVREIANAAAK